MEEWRPAPGWEECYEVSNHGYVRRIGRRNSAPGRRTIPRPVTRCLNDRGHGYWHVHLSQRGVAKTVLVHQLVAGAFIGPCPTAHEVNHKDGNSQNAHVTNLEYVTRRENNIHAIQALGRQTPKGSQQWKAKLTEADIKPIRQMKAEGILPREIARLFNVATTTVYCVLSGHTWKHV
jgi:hypothetical protein